MRVKERRRRRRRRKRRRRRAHAPNKRCIRIGQERAVVWFGGAGLVVYLDGVGPCRDAEVGAEGGQGGVDGGLGVRGEEDRHRLV